MQLLRTIFLILIGLSSLHAQPPADTSGKKIEIIFARRLSPLPARQGQKLRGGVEVRHDSTTIFCDSLLLFEATNRVEAYGRVRVVMPSSTMYCRRLDYEGNTRIARAREKIRLINGKSELRTNQLNYYRNEEYGEYRAGGTLYNEADTLSSRYGYYYPNEDMAYFKRNVVLRSPDYRLETDTLGYNTQTKTAVFLSRTQITNADGQLLADAGTYNTRSGKLDLKGRNELQNEDYKMFAQKLDFDRKSGIGFGLGRVRMEPTDSSMTLFGEWSRFDENRNMSWVTDSAVAVQYFDDDTLYLTSDTLFAFEDSAERRFFHAYERVFFYMHELQGRADSLVYRHTDSTLELYGSPVLWADSSQITGDTIRLYLANGKADSMVVLRDAFVISMADSTGFNQIKGRHMYINFRENKLERLQVVGNSETLYFVKDDEANIYLARSKTVAQEMLIFMEDNQVVRIKNYRDFSLEADPFWQIMFDANELTGMNWQPDLRPVRPDSAREFAARYERNRPAIPQQMPDSLPADSADRRSSISPPNLPTEPDSEPVEMESPPAGILPKNDSEN